jgi:SRSO17 transposase
LPEYQHIFRNSTKKFFDKPEKYSKGLLLCVDWNIERICESQHGLDHFQVQHFISDSNWDSRDAIDLAAIQISNALPRRKLTGLIIDETVTLKKGDKSVGVGWQYCGNAGKIANCQASGVSCLRNGDFASITDVRLFLPPDWCGDASRCETAGIPIENRGFKSKTEIAYDIVLHQLQLGVSFDFVGADGFYGNDTEMADKLNDLGCTYMFDIHSNQGVFLEEPKWVLPQKKASGGETPN